MSDPPQPPPSSSLIIPPDVQEKFGALIELIKGSESMNMEERQYWINILTVMTPEQIKNLQDILTNEKEQLAAIDAKYSKEATASGSQTSIASIEEKIKTQKSKRLEKEQAEESQEGTKEEDLLKQIESL